MQVRGHLDTERRNDRSRSLDQLPIEEAFDIISTEDCSVAPAVASAKAEICRAIELVIMAFEAGGRLIYVGAGTSGRLGVLDAAECPPTFLSNPDQVQAIIAGGDAAIRRSVEGAEDDAAHGEEEVRARHVTARDVVLGISSGATTPFVHGALRQARRMGAKTVFLACVPHEQFADNADVSIRILTGPEVLTGSTRLKAGTATKLALNMVTTLAMAGTGKVYGNLMVDLNCRANAKLTDRGIRIIQEITGLERAEASRLLDRAGGRVKTAVVMHLAGVDASEADQRLALSRGRLRSAVERGD